MDFTSYLLLTVPLQLIGLSCAFQLLEEETCQMQYMCRDMLKWMSDIPWVSAPRHHGNMVAGRWLLPVRHLEDQRSWQPEHQNEESAAECDRQQEQMIETLGRRRARNGRSRSRDAMVKYIEGRRSICATRPAPSSQRRSEKSRRRTVASSSCRRVMSSASCAAGPGSPGEAGRTSAR